jgi:hypothetical protein
VTLASDWLPPLLTDEWQRVAKLAPLQTVITHTELLRGRAEGLWDFEIREGYPWEPWWVRKPQPDSKSQRFRAAVQSILTDEWIRLTENETVMRTTGYDMGWTRVEVEAGAEEGLWDFETRERNWYVRKPQIVVRGNVFTGSERKCESCGFRMRGPDVGPLCVDCECNAPEPTPGFTIGPKIEPGVVSDEFKARLDPALVSAPYKADLTKAPLWIGPLETVLDALWDGLEVGVLRFQVSALLAWLRVAQRPDPLLGLEEACTVLDAARRKGKYAARNWELGHAWSIPMSAFLRHALAVVRGDPIDPEFGLPHASHASACYLMLATYIGHPKYAQHNDLELERDT